MTRKGILINVTEKTVTEVQVGDFKHMQELIGCNIFTTVSLRFPDGETLFVDDEGLLQGKTQGFKIEGYPQPLMGNGLIIGVNHEDGENADVTITCEEIEASITFIDFDEAPEPPMPTIVAFGDTEEFLDYMDSLR